MSDSGDFQDVESNYSGRLSHISGQLVLIPSSRSMFSRDRRMPLDSCNQSGLQENVVENQFSTVDSPRYHPQRSQSDDVQRNREAVLGAGRTKTTHSSEDRQNQGRHNSNADLCNKAVDFEFYNTGGITAELHRRTAKTANIGTAIRQIPSSTVVFGVENAIHNSSLLGLIFHRMLCCGSRKWRWFILWTSQNPRDQFVEKDFSNLEMLDAKIASALNRIIQHPQFKKISFEEQMAPKEDRFLRGRQIAFMFYDSFRVTGAHDTVPD